MTLKFEPPKENSEQFKYATYVEGYGGFRVHRSLGAAKQVFQGRAGAYGRSHPNRLAFKILHLVDGNWYVLYDIPAGTKKEDLPWFKEVTDYRYERAVSGEWKRVETTSKVAKPISREEYADFRVAVELERRGIS